MDISKQNLLLVGFIIIAVVSGWLSFKQACVVDAMGDVASLKAEIFEIRNEMGELKSEEKPDEDEIKELEEELEELNKEMPGQRQDVESAAASLPNGAVIWVILIQIGAAVFGVGLIKMLQNSEESDRIRSMALLILGAFTIFLLLGKIVYMASGIGAGGM